MIRYGKRKENYGEKLKMQDWKHQWIIAATNEKETANPIILVMKTALFKLTIRKDI